MKRSPFLIAILLLVTTALHAQVGINTTGASPDPSAGLDINFTDKGLLPPRVALTSITSAGPVTSPATGLLVYNTATAGASPNNVAPGYYCWNGTKWFPVADPPGTNVGDMQYWNGSQWVVVPAGTNGKVLTFNYGKPIWGQASYPSCGTSFTVNHIEGSVAPVTKTVTYGTVTNVPGEPTKCWITSNLGADHQATGVSDVTEASAGWYWQFNRKQGYKHDGTTRTPNTTWITSNTDPSDWTLANDPCVIELGVGWRIPTSTEWNNVDAGGAWSMSFDAWQSSLKMHQAGYLGSSSGGLGSRGIIGLYYSSNPYTSNGTTSGYYLYITAGQSYVDHSTNYLAMTLRCIRDY
jgi:hypothetical protein